GRSRRRSARWWQGPRPRRRGGRGILRLPGWRASWQQNLRVLPLGEGDVAGQRGAIGDQSGESGQGSDREEAGAGELLVIGQQVGGGGRFQQPALGGDLAGSGVQHRAVGPYARGAEESEVHAQLAKRALSQ